MIKLSKASKMPCRSWSLQAIDTCPASRDETGNLVPACAGCYAATGNYRFPNVKAPRLHNQEDWKRDEWVNDMVSKLDNDRLFRWFDSGDMYDIRLAKKIYQVMAATPWVKHWLPTRMHKFAKFSSILQSMEKLPNVVVRYSSDHIDGTEVQGANTSTIVPDETHARAHQFICRSSEREGKCGTCRACWDKDIKVVAYQAHGVSMKKQIKLLNIIEV